jgi:hypothetical protein
MNILEVEEQRDISLIFMDYGWFVAPFLTVFEFDKVKEVAIYIKNNQPATDQDRINIEERIYHCLKEPVFAQVYRARATWYGNQLNHLKEFNHLYESAMFSYYKRDYAQAVSCLLIALEGVMLSFYGYTMGGTIQKPDIQALIARIRKTRSGMSIGSDMDKRHNIYRDILVKFLQDWLYKHTDQSDFTISVLNRHYVLHGIDAGNFYRPEDLHRLILAFDLLIEFLCYPQQLFRTLLPNRGEDDFLWNRED